MWFKPLGWQYFLIFDRLSQISCAEPNVALKNSGIWLREGWHFRFSSGTSPYFRRPGTPLPGGLDGLIVVCCEYSLFWRNSPVSFFKECLRNTVHYIQLLISRKEFHSTETLRLHVSTAAEHFTKSCAAVDAAEKEGRTKIFTRRFMDHLPWKSLIFPS